MLRTFTKAEEYIYIEQDKNNETKAWMETKQRKNGCFEMVGSLFNQRMKVGWKFLQIMSMTINVVL